MRGVKKHYNGRNISYKPVSFNLPSKNDGICEIGMTIDQNKAREIEIRLTNDSGEHVDMIYDVAKKTFTMNRSKSGQTAFSNHFLVPTTAPTLQEGKEVTLRLFVDRSSIEAFDGEGRFAMTNLVFPTTPYTKLTVKAIGGNAKLKGLDIYEINI